ncbi:MAG: VWA domain-containing protein [Fibrobacteria bacterium]|nr:VWA domain-containing protein [Fibrobacteria bacterium]
MLSVPKFIVIFLLSASVGFSGYKQGLDLHKVLSKSGKAVYWPKTTVLSNSMLSATLVSGGYFTIGTKEGFKDEKLDNNCSITFGHPYAKTSYVKAGIDGNWGKLSSFEDFELLKEILESKRMLQSYALDNGIELDVIVLFNSTDSSIITLDITLRNTDDKKHSAGIQIVVDPALCHSGGDGYARIENNLILTPHTSDKKTFLITEHKKGLTGLNTQWTVVSSHYKNTFWNNWLDIDDNTVASFPIYDLSFKVNFSEIDLAPGDSITHSLKIKLNTGDYGKSIFTRWHIPKWTELGEGEMLPIAPTAQLQFTNRSSSQKDVDLVYNWPIMPNVDLNAKVSAIPAGKTAYLNVPITLKENYTQSRVDTYEVQVLSSGTTQGYVNGQMYVPALPKSFDGINITLDSVVKEGNSLTQFSFNALDEERNRYLFNISKDNIFIQLDDVPFSGFEISKDTLSGASMVDVVFILDVTGSMGGEIAAVRDNIIQFGDALSLQGIDYQLGMVTFYDVIGNIYPLTQDIELFKSYVGQQQASGGGDGPENSLDALMEGALLDFRKGSQKIFIWITDYNYHEADNITSRTTTEVVNTLLSKDITVHCIGSPTWQQTEYLPIYSTTGGSFYDINGNFQDILLDIANLDFSTNMLLSVPNSSLSGVRTLTLALHKADIGGTLDIDVNTNVPWAKRSADMHDENTPCQANNCTNTLATIDMVKGMFSITNLQGRRLVTKRLSHESINVQGILQQYSDTPVVVQLFGVDKQGRNINQSFISRFGR